ncbi:hypothetical protein K488DRAFT_81200 [Vararia minispora EC-137]|uniref:Uncharacterized protein n=1 Tax=Vararia minispora EC-137 TaxID=1314806 RepID=A0ACB8Q641_9AGAM|nr:hypothetical protein K488DRAFT_81200 [Vararia minispora EC-137]
MLLYHYLLSFVALLLPPLVSGQDALGLADGFLNFTSADLKIALVKDSQTLFSLKPARENTAFDFMPSDVMSERAANGNYHLGDIYFRARVAGSSAWTTGDSSISRKRLAALSVSGNTLAAANLGPTLPSGSLLNITRRWVLNNQKLQLLFDVANSQTQSVEVGALGAPLEFNNIFTGRTAADTNNLCSLFDPYIGQDAGFVQVTPLLGTLPPLVVTPVGKSPLEGWRFLPEDTGTVLGYQGQTFEGLYEWSFHTLAYAQNEWANSSPWNTPTSFTLAPGQTRTYGLQFNLAPSIRDVESTLQAAGRPVAVGIPGYVVPTDSPAKLFLSHPSTVSNIAVSPAGALTWTTNTDPASSAWIGYTITSHNFGRARLIITFADGTVQTVHYFITNPAVQQVSNLGDFLTNEQWFDNSSDPFHRSPSVISYDRQINAPVRDDPRAWIPGLSDEAGAGSWLTAVMKQFVQPSAAEVTKLESFVAQTLWGSVQNANGTVKKSVYFYQPGSVNYVYPSSIDWGNWWSWNMAASYATDRAYDYVHVANAYWSMYRVARNYPALVKTHTWQWYLNQAVLTISSAFRGGVGNANDGLMGETVFRYILDDLIREGLTANASLVQSKMQARHAIWAAERFPFGSEMAWDSTGQEGVYAWSVFFNDTTTALNVLNSILAYQPTVAHWGYNGNARRYWDNIYGGKLMRIERQIHHYGSGLNALPLLSSFERNTSDTYLLRVGFGGISGPLTNIDQGGFASASFHSFEDTLEWDGYSGDYGPNFVGLSVGTGMYLVNMSVFGWQAFGGVITSTSPVVRVTVTDAVRRKVFIAPLGQALSLDAGAFQTVVFNPTTRTVAVTILPAPSGVANAAAAPQGRLLVTQTATVSGVKLLTPSTTLTKDAGAYAVPFSGGQATVTLQA